MGVGLVRIGFVKPHRYPRMGEARRLGLFEYLLGYLRTFLGSRGVGMHRVPWGAKWGTRWGTLFGGSPFHRRGAVMLPESVTVPQTHGKHKRNERWANDEKHGRGLGKGGVSGKTGCVVKA